MKKNAIDKNINTWSNEEVLTQFGKFFDRIQFDSEFIQDEEDGLVTHQVLIIRAGDKMIVSEPQPLEWPLQPLPLPEAFEGRLN